MSKSLIFAATLLTFASNHLLANESTLDEMTVVMKSSSEPGEEGELLVFVGEQISYQPQQFECDRCFVFDSWYTARYRVVHHIHGVPPDDELTFSVAEHATRSPFGYSRFALVFVERFENGYSLVKYTQKPVYPTIDGGFATCGPYWRPDNADAPLNPGPALREMAFSPRLVVDDARRLSAFGRTQAHDPRWHAIEGDEVVCRRGVPLQELVRVMVRDDDMLSVALPQFAGDGR